MSINRWAKPVRLNAACGTTDHNGSLWGCHQGVSSPAFVHAALSQHGSSASNEMTSVVDVVVSRTWSCRVAGPSPTRNRRVVLSAAPGSCA